MDHATLTDNSGRKADFRHVILIMTSNAGSREANLGSIGFSEDQETSSTGRLKVAIERIFSPEFRNRLDGIVSFRALSQSTMETIVEKFKVNFSIICHIWSKHINGEQGYDK